MWRHFHFLVAISGAAFVGGCGWFSAARPVKSESVGFVAHAEVLAPGDSMLQVRVLASNSGTLTWRLEIGNCSMNIRVATLPPAVRQEWDYRRWRTAVNPNALCLGYVEAWQLPPGRSITSPDLQRIVRVRDVLGDSLPAGRYRVTASVDFSSQSTVDVEAGEVELRTRH